MISRPWRWHLRPRQAAGRCGLAEIAGTCGQQDRCQTLRHLAHAEAVQQAQGGVVDGVAISLGQGFVLPARLPRRGRVDRGRCSALGQFFLAPGPRGFCCCLPRSCLISLDVLTDKARRSLCTASEMRSRCSISHVSFEFLASLSIRLTGLRENHGSERWTQTETSHENPDALCCDRRRHCRLFDAVSPDAGGLDRRGVWLSGTS